MKAYVIKNKKGKYLSSIFDYDGGPIFTDCIMDAMPYDEDEVQMVGCLSDCEVIEITIAEGDLEQQIKEKYHQIAVLEKALEMARQENVENMVENSGIKDPIGYFISQAEKELEGEDATTD